MGLIPGARLSKETVKYRPSEKCAFCDNFAASGVCRVVDGNVAPDAICNEFTIKSATSNDGKDASFYMDAYKKDKE